MSRHRAINMAWVGAAGLSLSASLSGCVAAAIPVLAGGILVRSATDGKSAEQAAVPQTATGTATVAASVPAPLPEPAGTASATGTLVVATPGEAPPPDAPEPGNADDPFAALARYAQQHSANPANLPGSNLYPSGSAHTVSAVLLDPTRLNQSRKPCTNAQRAVLIDLDPGQSTFAPGDDINAHAGAAKSLASVRESGVEIAWISGISAAYAGDVRVALKESALDPDGKDTLLLMRYPSDRKQTRREDLAASSCLIAIAGDERRDFDELFAYLVNPEAALGLELLIGDGWFLVPDLVAPANPRNPLMANGEPTQ